MNLRQRKLCALQESLRTRKPVVEIPLRLVARSLLRQQLRRSEWMIGRLLERDPVADNVGEEIASVLELPVHIGEAVNNEACLSREPLGDGIIAHEMVLGPGPVFSNVRQFIMTDDDEQIMVRKSSALRRSRTAARWQPSSPFRLNPPSSRSAARTTSSRRC